MLFSLLLLLFMCLFPDNFLHHFCVCVSQVFEVEDVDRVLGEWKGFISTEKGFCVSSFKILEYFSITLLFLVLVLTICGGKLVAPFLPFTLLLGGFPF